MSIEFEHVETKSPELLELARIMLQKDSVLCDLPEETRKTADAQKRVMSALNAAALYCAHEIMFSQSQSP